MRDISPVKSAASPVRQDLKRKWKTQEPATSDMKRRKKEQVMDDEYSESQQPIQVTQPKRQRNRKGKNKNPANVQSNQGKPAHAGPIGASNNSVPQGLSESAQAGPKTSANNARQRHGPRQEEDHSKIKIMTWNKELMARGPTKKQLLEDKTLWPAPAVPIRQHNSKFGLAVLSFNVQKLNNQFGG